MKYINYKPKYWSALLITLSILLLIVSLPSNYQQHQLNPDILNNNGKLSSTSPHAPLNYASPKEIGSENTIFTSAVNTSDRSFQDLPDDFAGSQFHAMYVIPKNGIDRQFDINGDLNRSIFSFQNWLQVRTNETLLFDTYNGNLDITFVELNVTDDIIYMEDAFVRDRVEEELWNARLIENPTTPGNKIYAVYYDGRSNWACGGASYFSGNVVAMYLLGEPDGFPICDQPFTNNVSVTNYWEMAMLHDLLHGLKIVASQAPNHVDAGHTSDSPEDLMYAGSEPWDPNYVDLNNDDYFKHSGTFIDLEDSLYLASNQISSTTEVTSETTSITSSVSTSATTTPVATSADGFLFTMVLLSLLVSLKIKNRNKF